MLPQIIQDFLNNNNNNIIDKFHEKLNKKYDTSVDGYVYAFTRNNHNIIKFGITKRSVNQRVINELKGDPFYFCKTKFYKKVEKLFHLIFDYSRIVVIENNKKETEWFDFGTFNITTAIVSLISSELILFLEKKELNDIRYVPENSNNNKQDNVSRVNKQNIFPNNVNIRENIINNILEPKIIVDEKSKINKISIKDNLININTASEKELIKLRGIGKNLAISIICYRNNYGYFKNIEEIMKVPYIKHARFANIKDFITV